MSTTSKLVELNNKLQASISWARMFASAIPDEWPLPDVGMDQDGEVCFEWLMDNKRRMSVTIGGDGRLPYAWLAGDQRAHGVAIFNGTEIPKVITEGMGAILP